MATGIVSMALALQGHLATAQALLALDALLWAALAAIALHRLLFRPSRFLLEARSPAGLTGVAGTAVLGSRLIQLGWSIPAAALLALALLAWPVLTILVLPRLPRRGPGQVFMVTVATEGVAGLSAVLAFTQHAIWLAYLGLALGAAGLLAYPFLLVRFDLRALVRGRGDQWVVGGSLAISALTAGQLARAAIRLAALRGAAGGLEDLALALWLAAAIWIAPLLGAELLRPRLGYHGARWSTVFPLGMYAASASVVAAVDRVPPLDTFARIWIWVATAVWAAMAGGLLWRAVGTLAGP